MAGLHRIGRIERLGLKGLSRFSQCRWCPNRLTRVRRGGYICPRCDMPDPSSVAMLAELARFK